MATSVVDIGVDVICGNSVVAIIVELNCMKKVRWLMEYFTIFQCEPFDLLVKYEFFYEISFNDISIMYFIS